METIFGSRPNKMFKHNTLGKNVYIDEHVH